MVPSVMVEMPTFVTLQHFSCGDSLETRRKHDEDDGSVSMGIAALNIRCVQCICREVFHSAIDSMSDIPPSCIVELEQHFDLLKKIGLDEQLELLKTKILQPISRDEFLVGVLALAGFPLIYGRFIVGT